MQLEKNLSFHSIDIYTEEDTIVKPVIGENHKIMETTNTSSHLPTKSRGSCIYIFINSWFFSVLFLGFALLFFFFFKNPTQSFDKMAAEMPKSIYDITVQDISGNDVSLSDYKGKVLLIVNVASKCGLTHANYKEMNVLYEKYKDKGFEILAFPCNQFFSQEPGSNKEIQETVCSMFKAEFPIFDKIEVNGKDTAPIFQFLKSKKGGFFGNRIKWNFTKFLIDKDGKVVERYSPTISPLKIENTIQSLLGVS